MNNKKTLSIKKLDILFLSYFGIGFFPFAPGTAGTIATIPLIYLLSISTLTFLHIVFLVTFLTIISCLVADKTQKKYHVHDPSWIVIDEVIGMIITWMFYMGTNPLHMALLFILFRFFDIIKFWPASYFDKKMKHGAGTILDDVVSGVFAGLCYKIIVFYFPLF